MPYVSKETSNILYRLRHAKDAEEEYQALMDFRSTNPLERPNEATTADEIANAMNCFGFDNFKFTEAMGREHRTLQQTFTGVVFSWINHLANTEYYDLRNEASVKTCKRLVQLAELDGLYIGRLTCI